MNKMVWLFTFVMVLGFLEIAFADQDNYETTNSSTGLRVDIDSALKALNTKNSGDDAPESQSPGLPTFPFQWWADTRSGKLKIRNSTNDAWIIVGDLDTTNLGLGGGVSTESNRRNFIICGDFKIDRCWPDGVQQTGVTAQGSDANISPSNVFDGNDSDSGWLWSNNTAGWLKLDYGQGRTEIVSRIRFKAAHHSWSGAGIKNFTFEGSNDNANWNTLLTALAADDKNNYQEFDFANTASYRYYRINISDSYTSHIGLWELEFFESNPYYEISTTGTTNTVLQSDGGGHADNIYDNSEANQDYWVDDNATTSWHKTDFGSGNSQIVTRISFKAAHSSWGAAGVKDFTYEGSNDDSNWTTLFSGTAEDNLTSYQDFNLINQTAYRYYRFNINSSYAIHVGLWEMDLYGGGAPKISTTGTTNTASASDGGGSPDNLYDGSTIAQDYWVDDNASSGWHKTDFGSGNSKIVTRIRFRSAHSSWGNAGVNAFTYQGSNDDSSWTTLISANAGNDFNSYQQFDFPNITAYRYYRFNINSTHATQPHLGLWEMELFEGSDKKKISNTGVVFNDTQDDQYTSVLLKYIETPGAQVVNVSSASDAPDLSTDNGKIQTSASIHAGTANPNPGSADFAAMEYTVTGFDYAQIHGKEATLSFWVKFDETGISSGSSLNQTHCVSFANKDNTRSYVAEYNVNQDDTWEKVTIPLQLDNLNDFYKFNNQAGLKIRWPLMVGSGLKGTSGTWHGAGFMASSNCTDFLLSNSGRKMSLTGVKLELGGIASAWAPYAWNENVPNLEWYFERLGGNIPGEPFAMGSTEPNSINIRGPFNFFPKRVTPTLSNVSDGFSLTCHTYQRGASGSAGVSWHNPSKKGYANFLTGVFVSPGYSVSEGARCEWVGTDDGVKIDARHYDN